MLKKNVTILFEHRTRKNIFFRKKIFGVLITHRMTLIVSYEVQLLSLLKHHYTVRYLLQFYPLINTMNFNEFSYPPF